MKLVLFIWVDVIKLFGVIKNAVWERKALGSVHSSEKKIIHGWSVCESKFHIVSVLLLVSAWGTIARAPNKAIELSLNLAEFVVHSQNMTNKYALDCIRIHVAS